MDASQGSSARLLAPMALVTFAVVLLLVVSGSDVDENEDVTGDAAPVEQTSAAQERRRERRRASRVSSGVYVVKTGDTLASIADRTGLSVERLQELNPELDPQALVSGQRIRLR